MAVDYFKYTACRNYNKTQTGMQNKNWYLNPWFPEYEPVVQDLLLLPVAK
jgi:hypothetical protein